MTLAAAALLLALSFASADDYASGAVRSMRTDKDEILTNARGMTLYTYDKDLKGRSACSGKCATNWQPLVATEGAKAHGDFSPVNHTGGEHQWAHDDKPLYLWKSDSRPGDMTGDGVGDVWHAAGE